MSGLSKSVRLALAGRQDAANESMDLDDCANSLCDEVEALEAIVDKLQNIISTEITLHSGASVIDPRAPGHDTWNEDYEFQIHMTVKEIREFMRLRKAKEVDNGY